MSVPVEKVSEAAGALLDALTRFVDRTVPSLTVSVVASVLDQAAAGWEEAAASMVRLAEEEAENEHQKAWARGAAAGLTTCAASCREISEGLRRIT